MKRIDVQHHILPEEYVERLASIGITESYGQPFPKWTPERSLESMKKIGVDIAIMSISTPEVDLKDAQFAQELARFCNEYMAEVTQQYPGRFGCFAILPLPYVEDSLEELEYCQRRCKIPHLWRFKIPHQYI